MGWLFSIRFRRLLPAAEGQLPPKGMRLLLAGVSIAKRSRASSRRPASPPGCLCSLTSCSISTLASIPAGWAGRAAAGPQRQEEEGVALEDSTCNPAASISCFALPGCNAVVPGELVFMHQSAGRRGWSGRPATRRKQVADLARRAWSSSIATTSNVRLPAGCQREPASSRVDSIAARRRAGGRSSPGRPRLEQHGLPAGLLGLQLRTPSRRRCRRASRRRAALQQRQDRLAAVAGPGRSSSSIGTNGCRLRGRRWRFRRAPLTAGLGLLDAEAVSLSRDRLHTAGGYTSNPAWGGLAEMVPFGSRMSIESISFSLPFCCC